MEKADVLKSNIKSAEFKDAVFVLALDYPTIHITCQKLFYIMGTMFMKSR